MGHEGYGVIDKLGSGRDHGLGRAAGGRGGPGRPLVEHGLLSVPPVPSREHQPLHPPAREVPAAGRGLAVLHRDLCRLLLCLAHRPFYLVPRELPDAALSWVNCAMGTSAEGLDRANCQPGDYVVIQGAGGLGLCAAALATYRGAAKVIVLDRLPEPALAGRAVRRRPHDQRRRARHGRRAPGSDHGRCTDGEGADIVMELVGPDRPDSARASAYLSPGGTLVEIGHVMAGRTFSLDPRAIIRGKRIMGSSGYRHCCFRSLLDLMVKTQDRIPDDRIVSDRFPLDRGERCDGTAEWAGRRTAVTRAVLTP